MQNQPAPPFEPGIYPDMPRSEYDSIVALNQSTLKVILERHARAGYKRLVVPRQPSQAMIEGAAFHTLCLEPHLYDERFATYPTEDDGVTTLRRQGKAKLAIWGEWEADNLNRDGISVSKRAELAEQAGKLREHPVVGRWIRDAAYREFVVLWEHPRFGFPCKAQMDLIVSDVDGWTKPVDLKTTRNATQPFWEREIVNLGYMLQDAWYLQGLYELSPMERRFHFAVVETTEWMDVAIYEIGALTRAEAEFRIEGACRAWKRGLDSGAFDGMSTEAQPLEAPRWAMTHLSDEAANTAMDWEDEDRGSE